MSFVASSMAKLFIFMNVKHYKFQAAVTNHTSETMTLFCGQQSLYQNHVQDNSGTAATAYRNTCCGYWFWPVCSLFGL